MSYDDRVRAARKLIEQHNASLGEGEGVNVDDFFNRLRAAGGTSEATLASCTWEDLEDCGLPRILARSVSKHFRKEDARQDQIVIVDDDPEKRAKRLKPAELVAEYDLEEPDNPIGERLAKISKNQCFIVFTDDGKVNVAVSQQELQRLRDNYPERKQVLVEGLPRRTHTVGERPDRYVDEHPLFKGTPLNPDGTSDKGIAWGGLALNVRQLVHLAINVTNEVGSDEYDEFDFFDIVDRNFERVASRYPQAAVKFKELSDIGELPKLKIRLGNGNSGNADWKTVKNNPFGQHKQY